MENAIVMLLMKTDFARAAIGRLWNSCEVVIFLWPSEAVGIRNEQAGLRRDVVA